MKITYKDFNEVKQIIMDRDTITAQEADNRIDDAIVELNALLSDPTLSVSDFDESCYDTFALEPEHFLHLL
jgi:hypothetical protein